MSVPWCAHVVDGVVSSAPLPVKSFLAALPRGVLEGMAAMGALCSSIGCRLADSRSFLRTLLLAWLPSAVYTVGRTIGRDRLFQLPMHVDRLGAVNSQCVSHCLVVSFGLNCRGKVPARSLNFILNNTEWTHSAPIFSLLLPSLALSRSTSTCAVNFPTFVLLLHRTRCISFGYSSTLLLQCTYACRERAVSSVAVVATSDATLQHPPARFQCAAALKPDFVAALRLAVAAANELCPGC